MGYKSTLFYLGSRIHSQKGFQEFVNIELQLQFGVALIN
jgi:hypothetical protein